MTWIGIAIVVTIVLVVFCIVLVMEFFDLLSFRGENLSQSDKFAQKRKKRRETESKD